MNMKFRLHSLSIALSITSRSVTTWETYSRVRPMSTRSTSVSRPVRPAIGDPRSALPLLDGRLPSAAIGNRRSALPIGRLPTALSVACLLKRSLGPQQGPLGRLAQGPLSVAWPPLVGPCRSLGLRWSAPVGRLPSALRPYRSLGLRWSAPGARSVFDRHSPSVAWPKGPSVGIAHIQSSLSNTIISITDTKGNVKTWSSSGTVGFKGSRRSTNYAAQATAETVARNAVLLGFRLVEVRIQGLGYGKESSLRGLQIGGLIITKIHDITPMPHNGCRPPKKRRV
jgi:small subunit ribosomal protein S11